MRLPSRRLTVAAVAVALALLPHISAQAALPTSTPTIKKPCPNNPDKTLRIWASKAPFAVDNPCRDWFVILHKPLGQGDYAIETISVAGYSKVSLPIDMRTQSWRWLMRSGPIMCGELGDRAFGTVSKAYYGDGRKLNLEGSGLGCDYDH